SVGDHRLRRGADLVWALELPALGEVEEGLVGRAPPQEIRKTRGDLEAAQPEDPGPVVDRSADLDPVEEARILEHRPDDGVDADVEVAGVDGELLDAEVALDLLVRERSTKRLAPERLDEVLEAFGVVGARRRATDDGVAPA